MSGRGWVLQPYVANPSLVLPCCGRHFWLWVARFAYQGRCCRSGKVTGVGISTVFWEFLRGQALALSCRCLWCGEGTRRVVSWIICHSCGSLNAGMVLAVLYVKFWYCIIYVGGKKCLDVSCRWVTWEGRLCDMAKAGVCGVSARRGLKIDLMCKINAVVCNFQGYFKLS